ncbi:MAG: hypothetical protein J7M26_10695, partial [Armatimonadetes bacterium]|nr:hypothetical protein [Armatimonadota bacterium]
MSKTSFTARTALALGRFLARLSPRAHSLAEPLLRRAAAETPKAEAWLAYVEGLRASARGDEQEALAKLRAASVGLRDEAGVAVALALALANADQWEVAIEAGERALKFFEEAGSWTQPWNMLAWSYLITGRYASVMELMQRMRDAGLSLAPVQLPVLLARAVLWDEEPPIPVLRSLLRRSAGHEGAWLRFVEHLAETGGHDDLATMLLAQVPTSAAVSALERLAAKAAEANKPELVLWCANALRRLELAPELSLALASIASLAAGEDKAAATYARKAAELGPEQTAVQEHLALVWFLLGDETQARSAAAKALLLGSRDALCAGLVAVGLLEKGEVREARRLFVVQRLGYALGALVGHLAQAWIFAADGDASDLARVLGFAVNACRDLPAWTRRAELRAFAERCLDGVARLAPEEAEEENFAAL